MVTTHKKTKWDAMRVVKALVGTNPSKKLVQARPADTGTPPVSARDDLPHEERPSLISTSIRPMENKIVPSDNSAHPHKPAVCFTSAIRWVDGLPVPVARPMISKEGIRQLPQAVMSLQYEGNPNDPLEDPEYLKMTNAEVMLIKLANNAGRGDIDATRMLLEYSIGKPKQEIESKQLKLTYQDYLEEIARKEQEEGVGSPVADTVATDVYNAQEINTDDE